jgi:hypothetical protein
MSRGFVKGILYYTLLPILTSMVKREKTINVCPKCFSKNIAYDKGYLPGGIELFEFDVYLCKSCGIRLRKTLLVDESQYKEAYKKFKLKRINTTIEDCDAINPFFNVFDDLRRNLKIIFQK